MFIFILTEIECKATLYKVEVNPNYIDRPKFNNKNNICIKKINVEHFNAAITKLSTKNKCSYHEWIFF